MITGSYSRYSCASSSSSIYFTPASGAKKNDRLIRKITEAIGPDPLFSKAVETGSIVFNLLHSFFQNRGNPATRIPELQVGNEIVRNISCLELAYRISKNDFKGMLAIWDNEGTKINSLFEEVICLGFKRISKVIKKNINTEEWIDLIQCFFAGDPYLSLRGKTANRFLDIVSKFLDAGGNPLLSVENVRFGRKVLSKQTIFELVSLLWKLPYGYGLDVEEWNQEEDSDEEEEWQGINDRFFLVVDRCENIIKTMLVKNQLADEDFLPLIRCAVKDDIEDQYKRNPPKQLGERFFQIMVYFVYRRVNPNLAFSLFEIDGSTYADLACFQLVYLILKDPKIMWDRKRTGKLDILFKRLLSDPRIDLTWRFSEYSLNSHHFVNTDNITYYRQKYPVGTQDNPAYYHGSYEPSESFIDEVEGYSLERITIAHYAAFIGDYMLLTECLDLEPRLMKMQCCLTKGKALLHRIHREESWIESTSGSLETDSLLETDDRLSCPLRILEKDYLGEQVSLESRIYRITNVTLLHLAARGGHEGILACLQSKHPNRAAVDSDNRIPQHYLQLSIEEGVLERIDSSERMFEALKPVTKLVRTLPQVNLIIHRKGYDLHYDTIGKVAKFVRQRLRKESFGAAKRTGHRWIDNLDIPELNRVIDRDYEGSGYDRGHLVPAEDATRSDRRMGDTFHPENAVPQNPNLNRGVWSQLEKHVHKLALSHDLVEVFTGPLFVPRRRLQGRVMAYPLMGPGDVHVPTHLFKIIFVHDRTTSAEVYIVPNVTQPPGTKFSAFKCIDPREGIDFIQRYSGILFREWMQNRPRIGS